MWIGSGCDEFSGKPLIYSYRGSYDIENNSRIICDTKWSIIIAIIERWQGYDYSELEEWQFDSWEATGHMQMLESGFLASQLILLWICCRTYRHAMWMRERGWI